MRINALGNTATDFASDDYIALDGTTNGSRKMKNDILLKLTAQNALAGNVAQAFDPTRDADHKYIAGENVVYEGKIYTFKVDHYGAWVASDVYERSVESFISQLHIDLDQVKLNKVVGKNLFNKNTLYKIAGKYVGYNTGLLHSNPDSTAFVVPVKAGDVLSFSNAANVAAFSVLPNLDDYSDYQKIIGYISGISTAEQGWSVPSGSVCLVVSPANSIVDTYQIEKGASSTSYETYKEGVLDSQVLGLSAKFIQQEENFDEKLKTKLNAEIGKNLFNKDTTNKRSNVYVQYNNGYITPLSGYSAYVVELPSDVTKVSINKIGAHVCAFSSVPNLPTSTGTIAGYLGGVTGAGNQGWTLPVGTKCLVVSWQDATIDELQIEKGASSTSYTPYVVGIDWSKVLNKPEETKKILYVGAGQEYTTIQAAVNAANDGDTIFIFPGTYTEAVDCASRNKFIRIVGFSRDSVVLTHSGSDYYYPPLEIGKGIVENMTIAVTGTIIDVDAIDGAYGVHIDYNQETNSSLQFKNCKFTSELRPCVGIGLRSGFVLSFVDCSFVCTSGQAPFYCHEEQSSNVSNQRVELINCSISNEGNNASDVCVTIQETPSLAGNNATILMQRCILKRSFGAFDASVKAVKLFLYGGGEPSGNKYLGSSTWNLDYMSELNNESIANSSEQ